MLHSEWQTNCCRRRGPITSTGASVDARAGSLCLLLPHHEKQPVARPGSPRQRLESKTQLASAMRPAGHAGAACHTCHHRELVRRP